METPEFMKNKFYHQEMFAGFILLLAPIGFKATFELVDKLSSFVNEAEVL